MIPTGEMNVVKDYNLKNKAYEIRPALAAGFF